MRRLPSLNALRCSRRRPADRRRPGPAARGRGRLRPAGAPLRAQAQHPAFRAGRGRAGQFPVQLAHPRLERFEAAHPDIRIRPDRGGRRPAEHPARRRADPGRPRLAARVAVTPLLAEATGPVCAPACRPPVASGRRAGRAAAAHSSRPEAWQDWAGRVGVKLAPRHPGREFDHLGHMLEAAAAGLGVAIAPAVLVEAELHRGRLAAPLGFVDSGAAFSLCTLKAQDAPPRWRGCATGCWPTRRRCERGRPNRRERRRRRPRPGMPLARIYTANFINFHNTSMAPPPS